MAISMVQNIGKSETTASAQTTTVLSVSKTVTSGNLITVGILYYGALSTSPTATDNLGNTYTLQSHQGNGTNSNSALLTAPVTAAGTLTTITVTHSSRQYRTILADEFSGVGAVSVSSLGTSGSGTTSTWCSSQTIPANGIAIGYVCSSTNDVMSAGSASGSPSTSITLGYHYASPGSASESGAFAYAIAGSGAVTTFSGTCSHASIAWAGAGAIFSPAASAAMRDPIGMMGFFGK